VSRSIGDLDRRIDEVVMPMTRIATFAAALTLTLAASAGAQMNTVAADPDAGLRPGWVFTPSLGVSEVYDDNITLFGNLEPLNNNDLVSSVGPAGSLTYVGRHTRFSSRYGASFLNYRTFSVFDRWNQNGQVTFRRQENNHFDWSGDVSGQAVPSTDLLLFNGIPFVQTGAQTFDARGGAVYKFDARNTVNSTIQYQRVTFDLPDNTFERYLRGGSATSFNNSYRRRMDERLSIGADYRLQRSQVRQDFDSATAHTIQAALTYRLSERWTVSGGGGIAVLTANLAMPGQTAPAFDAALDRNDRGQRFHLTYLQGFLPSFGLGGTQSTKEFAVGYFAPVARRFFTDHSATFRDDQPVLTTADSLQLRSLRTYSSFGWLVQRWVRIEAFYSHLAQSSLIAGGRLDRNRVGIQIVTSKPMRID
jgi:hypothetical protein